MNAFPEDQANDRFVALFLRFFLASIVLLVAVIGGFFYIDYTSELDLIVNREIDQATQGKRSLQLSLADVTSDVLLLAKSQSLVQYLDNASNAAANKIREDFLNLSRLKKRYNQVRLLDGSGKEVIRVNYKQGTPTLVPDNKLQNKQGRYYFDDAYKLQRDQIFVSPLDLNVERGQVERPFVPMVRIGTPVYQSSGDKFGIVLMNYFGSILIDELKKAMASTHGYPALINRDGYWLLGETPQDEWGFMLDNHDNMATRYPDAWAAMQQAASGSFSNPNGHFTWDTVTPVTNTVFTSTGSSEAFANSEAIDPNQYYWKVVTHIPGDQMEQIAQQRIFNAAQLIALLSLISLIGSYFMAKSQQNEQRANQVSRRKEQQLTAIISRLAEGLMVIGRQEQLLLMNPEAERLLGYSQAELKDQNIHLRIHPGTHVHLDHCPIANALSDGLVTHQEEDFFSCADGSSLPVAYTASPYIIDGKNQGIIVAFEDISERKRLRKELQHLASHDQLTGLHNRAEISRELDNGFNHARKTNQSFAVCMIDADHFKQVNDNYGHPAGDAVLRDLGALLQDLTRGADFAGRYGGEEFLVLLTSTDLDGATTWSEIFRNKLAEHSIEHAPGKAPLKITVSIGVAAMTPGTVSADELIKRADEKLYQAKDNGRNQVCS